MLRNSFHLGLEAEKLTLKYFENKGYELIQQRWMTPFAEVDLVFKSKMNNNILLVEVKKSSYPDYRATIISSRQKKRLERVVQWLSEKLSEKKRNVELSLVIVDEHGEIEEFQDFFG